MWECSAGIDIDSPPEQVYRRLRDLTCHSEFSDGLVKVEQAEPGPVRVGTRFRSEERVPGRFVSHSEITALEEPRLIGWRAWVEGVMRTEWELRLSPQGRGTHLVMDSRWAASGPIGFLMLNLHRRRNAPRENRRTLGRMKAVLEAERRAEVTA